MTTFALAARAGPGRLTSSASASAAASDSACARRRLADATTIASSLYPARRQRPVSRRREEYPHWRGFRKLGHLPDPAHSPGRHPPFPSLLAGGFRAEGG